MATKIFQNITSQTGDIIGKTVGVIDDNFEIIACSDNSKIGQFSTAFPEDNWYSESAFVSGDYTYKPFGTPDSPEYAVFISGTDDNLKEKVSVLAVTMNNAKIYFDDKFDKSGFIKNVLLDNILPGDIFLRARDFRFNQEATRVCMIVRANNLKSHLNLYDLVQELFPDKNKDFVISISDEDVAVVKEIKKDTDQKILKKLASSIVDNLSGEYYLQCVVGIGIPVEGIRDLARSYKEAAISIEVGKVFDNEKNVISYDNLGIARLVYQLPTTLCKTFLKEVFKHGSIDSLDQETLFTIQKFFENSLNVSETSRKLFIHRNTLVYRLDKIKKFTGLDLRSFEDSIVLKVALMVKKYLNANPTRI